MLFFKETNLYFVERVFVQFIMAIKIVFNYKNINSKYFLFHNLI